MDEEKKEENVDFNILDYIDTYNKAYYYYVICENPNLCYKKEEKTEDDEK